MRQIGDAFFGENEFNMPQTSGHACPPAIDHSECEVHDWRSVESFDGEVTEHLCICDRCGNEWEGDD
jgi:hypothetical protein